MIDARTASNLKGVHPDLVGVVMAAYQSSRTRFVVIQGLRTPEQERQNVLKGVSQTMHSRHLPNAQGLACAVDVMALAGSGKPDWDWHAYVAINAAMMAAAHDLHVPLEWGGDWKTLKDFGHFQLPWLAYPADGSMSKRFNIAAAPGPSAPPAASPPAGTSHV